MRKEPCLNCGELNNECACLRNKCIRCGNPVGNITFTVCDDCWDKEHPPQNLPKADAYSLSAEVRALLTSWEQFKKDNWYKSESVDVDKLIMDKFTKIVSEHFS